MDLHDSINNIKKGKELEVSIPFYSNEMADLYERVDSCTLSFAYMVLREYFLSKPESYRLNDYKEILTEAIDEGFLAEFDGAKREKIVKELLDTRAEIKVRTEALLDLCGKAQVMVEDFDDIFYPITNESLIEPDDFAKQVLNYIFENKDNNIINTRLKQVLERLPVRYTRVKFLDILTSTVDLYKKADKDTYDTFLSAIRSSCGMNDVNAAEEHFPEITKSFYEAYDKAKKERTPENAAKVVDAIKTMLDVVDTYELLINTINDLICVLLAMPYSNVDTSKAKKAVEKINELVKEGRAPSPDESKELDDILNDLSVMHEKYYTDLATNQMLLDVINEKYMSTCESIMAATEVNDLLICRKLNSGSAFANLTENGFVELTESYFSEEKEKLIAEFKKLFGELELSERRSVMAKVLGTIPVYFENRTDVMNYVRSSLKSADEGEYTKAVTVISKLWRE